VERAAIEDALLTWLTARSPRSMGIALIGVIVFGTIGYWIVAGGDISLLDAIYMALITISTVGYGDLVNTDIGRIFSIIYIVVGVGVFSLTISTLAAALVAGRLGEVFGRRRMEREINALKDHLILCGFGRFGQITGSEITRKGVPLVIVDLDPKVIDSAEEHGLLGLMADATEEESLEKAGIARARALLCTLPTDAENVYAILNARELNPDIPIVALARDRRAESKLLRAGANYVVSPYSIGATHMARQILAPNLAQVFNLAAAGGEEGLEQVGVQLDEVPLGHGSPLVGVSLKASPIKRELGVMLVAVIDADGARHFNPGPDLVLREGAVLVSIGPVEGLAKLRIMGAGSPPAPEIEE